MEPWMLSELEPVLGCSIPVEAQITAVSTDTRDLPKGCLFIALRGDRFDAHDFAAQAIEAGAAAVVTERQIGELPCLVVENTRQALLQIAAFYRSRFTPFLVGVTGSVGKTTTKEMIACVLEAQFDTLKTQGNLNNEIGLPKTLFSLEARHGAAVVEMGMNHFGEISRLTRTAKPCAAVITNIGYSHIENLGSQEGILKAKLEILEGMAADAPLVVNADDRLLSALPAQLDRPVITYGLHNPEAQVQATEIERMPGQTNFIIRTKENDHYSVTLPCVGDHNILNALAAFCVGRLAGIAPEKICAALANYRTVGLRQNISKIGDYTVIADCYNASPDSMRAALSVLQELPCKGRRIAVLGDMLELGEMSKELHTLVGEMVAQKKADALFCYGTLSFYTAQAAAKAGIQTFHTDDRRELCRAIRQFLRPEDMLLFKASRGMRLEDSIAEIFEQEEETNAVLG